ncbi:PAS domain S-box protein [Belnapia sp. T18]|uniref:histidine kinase n=2 Tax=Belnapia arida TaxID=2804533 RepID=A0ABS1U823_9PROT|nr:PAS domain S-box protein [Belnapia arida]
MTRHPAPGPRETVTEEELQVALEELRATADELEESNAALTHLNESLEDHVTRRTAELEQALATLRVQEQRLRLIFEGATDTAILTLDDEGRISAWNPGAERLLGFTEAEVLGHRLEAMWLPEDLERREPEQEMCRALDAGRADDERWHRRKDGTRFWASGIMVPLAAGPDGKSRGFLKIMRDRTEPRREEERRLVLLRELDHRVKNTLAVVQSVTIQSRRYAPTPADFQDALLARLAALARSHDLLTRNSWEGASLRDIVRQTLAPYATKVGQDRVSLQGPPVRLTPTAVVTLNLAFHELATNAAKYGALSAPGGRVEVGWHIDRTTNAKPQLEVHWNERGGPPVQVPVSRGFGTRLIERGLSREFDAAVQLDFAPAGVECMIRLPFAPRLVSL